MIILNVEPLFFLTFNIINEEKELSKIGKLDRIIVLKGANQDPQLNNLMFYNFFLIHITSIN